MHYLHPSSPDCCKSELDLFSVPPTQTSISETNLITINPINSVTNTDVPLEFHIPGSSDQYLDPSNVFLYFKVKFTNNDGSELTGNDHTVYPTTNFLYSCFNQIEVYLNETSLGASAANYAYRSYIETLVNFNTDTKDSLLETQGYYSLKDESKFIDKCAKRKNNIYEYYNRINGDLFSQERLILPSVDIKIRLSRSSPQFALNVFSKPAAASDPPTPIYNILDAYLYVRKVKLSPQRHMEIEKNLLSSTAKYPIKRIETKIYNFTAGLSAINLNNVVIGNLPQKVIIGMVSHANMSGGYSLNPFKFEHFCVREIGLQVNGQSYGKPYKTAYSDSDNSLCSRPFYELYANTCSCSDTGIDIKAYVEHSNIYAFDLSADMCSSSGGHLNIVKQGTLGIQLNFEKPLSAAISLVVYLEIQHLIELDRMRNALLTY